MKLTRYGLYDPKFEHDACGIGAVANISGLRERRIIDCARQVILNLHHRGAAGSDDVTGDGAGILMQIPHEFLAAKAGELDLVLPAPGEYGAAMVFEPRDEKLAAACEDLLASAVEHYGMRTIGWRDVPGDTSDLGELAISAEPRVRQAFIDAGSLRGDDLERKCYLARKRAERLAVEQFGDEADDFYLCSMSARTMVYKGMFMAHQLFSYYPDLLDERMISAMAVVHQRYSTNTLPNWKLAQPFRYVAHNGEINTLSGNRNHMRANEMNMASPLFGKDIADLFPILSPDASDSACFDAALELLTQSGRSLPHAMMMLIPEAFGERYHISTDKRAFYEYHAAIQEPWDGPAAMVFTDGKIIGGTLDRNGLRPARYVVTTDGLVVLSSEVGVIDFPPEQVQLKGRLRPGLMFLVDTIEQRIVTDNEIKSRIARQKPYRWLSQNRIELRGLFSSPEPPEADPLTLYRRLRSFGYTREDLQAILVPMARDGQEPIGSMGNDASLAVLSDKPKLLYSYFKQMFAQVTNPPIDPYREELVMSLMSYTGRSGNLLAETPEHCRMLKLPHPILGNEDMLRLRKSNRDDFRIATVNALFDAGDDDPGEALRRGLDELVDQAGQAVRDGASLVIISDRDADQNHAAIPAMLAVGAVHHGLLQRGLRGETGLVVESGEPREVMHFCLLSGHGANAVNPYLAFEALENLRVRGDLPKEMGLGQLADNYVAAIKKGILKAMSKMGISTLRSYHGAQLFEAIGLAPAMVDTYFTGTPSRIGGIGLDDIARETITRHRMGFDVKSQERLGLELDFGGEYQFRCEGENHLWNPTTITRLQHAATNNDQKAYDDFAQAINDQSRKLCTLRGMFDFKYANQPVPLDEVEPASEIVKRFCTGAMSHGSISKEAHEALAVAMNRLGGMSNTGEGGEDPRRYELETNGDSRNSAIKQIASGRFGVTAHYLANAHELQIKMAQGAKPGEGGQLPGHKVTEEIARLRHSTPGVTLISPPPHHDIYSIEDLAQLIYDLKCSNPEANISVKLVSEVGVGTIAAGVAKGRADEVLISGHDGGTGASPLSSIKHAGIPWELGLSETQQVLVQNGLRDRIRVQVDGQLRTGRDVVIGAMLGADQFGFGTAALITLGCVMMRKCHLGTCPVGVATQDPELRKRFAGKPEYLVRYLTFVAEDIRAMMARLGFRKFDDMIGRVDCLDRNRAIDHWKARGLDFSAILASPRNPYNCQVRLTQIRPRQLEDHLDWKILEQATSAIAKSEPVRIAIPIRNTHRTVGAILSNRIAKLRGPEGLPDGTLDIHFRGSAGQSFGAFLVPGVTLRLVGDANDYVGKGLSGGRVIVQTPPESPFEAHRNIVAGNVILYGATSGELYVNGAVGERFCVRNSGATAVVEGVGDHGCEYMTGGVAVILGETGRNFGAGMSGGIAYVLDEMQLFDTRCNLDTVDLEYVWQNEDRQTLRELIERHHKLTASPRARHILDNWNQVVGRFVKVMPIEYRKSLERIRQREDRGTETTPATEEVFHG